MVVKKFCSCKSISNQGDAIIPFLYHDNPHKKRCICMYEKEYSRCNLSTFSHSFHSEHHRFNFLLYFLTELFQFFAHFHPVQKFNSSRFTKCTLTHTRVVWLIHIHYNIEEKEGSMTKWMKRYIYNDNPFLSATTYTAKIKE